MVSKTDLWISGLVATLTVSLAEADIPYTTTPPPREYSSGDSAMDVMNQYKKRKKPERILLKYVGGEQLSDEEIVWLMMNGDKDAKKIAEMELERRRQDNDDD